MKTGIHPEYQLVNVTCACGATYEIGTTKAEFSHVDICSNCHPLFTGRQKLVDTEGRVERFRKRYSAAPTAKTTIVKKAPRSRRRVQNVLEGLKSLRKAAS